MKQLGIATTFVKNQWPLLPLHWLSRSGARMYDEDVLKRLREYHSLEGFWLFDWKRLYFVFDQVNALDEHPTSATTIVSSNRRKSISLRPIGVRGWFLDSNSVAGNSLSYVISGGRPLPISSPALRLFRTAAVRHRPLISCSNRRFGVNIREDISM
jgi:hypothetical protein